MEQAVGEAEALQRHPIGTGKIRARLDSTLHWSEQVKSPNCWAGVFNGDSNRARLRTMGLESFMVDLVFGLVRLLIGWPA